MDWSSIALKNIIEIRVDIEIFAFRFVAILCFDPNGYKRYLLKSYLLCDQPKDLYTRVEFDIPLLL